MDRDTNKKHTSNYDYVAEVLMELLVKKNPLFAMEREKRMSQIIDQYDRYLEAGIISLLTQRQYDELTEIALEYPNDLKKKNEFLASQIEDIDKHINVLTKEFIDLYAEKIRNL